MPDEATDRRRRKDALKLLATLRQAEVDDKTAAAYLLGVSDLPPDVLEQAVRDIGYRARDEYEPKWPELGTIRSRCEAILRHQREERESRRLLNAAPPEPISPERMEEIMAKFRAVLKRKVMP